MTTSRKSSGTNHPTEPEGKEERYGIKPLAERRKVAGQKPEGKDEVDRPGADLGGASKEGRKGVHTTIPGGPRQNVPVGNSRK
ncbi:hypothetical protein [Microbaculum marinum]|uniref:Uncharacterized protein n=1 Tax=Microbaculum marinum TaxID=1764581 RepID=A0AAW9RJM1_9HYPH